MSVPTTSPASGRCAWVCEPLGVLPAGGLAVARRHTVGLNHVHHTGAELVERVGQLHAVDLGRVNEALHVLGQAEDRRPAGLAVTADAFKYAGPVVDHVTHHVDGGLFPRNQAPVVPDLFSGMNGHGGESTPFCAMREPSAYRAWGRYVTKHRPRLIAQCGFPQPVPIAVACVWHPPEV